MRWEYDAKKMQSIEKRPVEPGKTDAHHSLGEGGGLAVDGTLSESRQRYRLFTPHSRGSAHYQKFSCLIISTSTFLCLSIASRSDEMKQRPKETEITTQSIE